MCQQALDRSAPRLQLDLVCDNPASAVSSDPALLELDYDSSRPYWDMMFYTNDYFDEADYFAQSPGLNPVIVRTTPSPEPPGLEFPPLWLPEDINHAPLAPSPWHIDSRSIGCFCDHCRSRIFPNDIFIDTLLLHQMSPDDPELALQCGTSDFLSRRLRAREYSRSRAHRHTHDTDDEDESGWDEEGDDQMEEHQRRNVVTQTSTSPMSISSSIESQSEPMSRRVRLEKIRLVLPLTVNGEGLAVSVLACADTGADANIISDELAKTLGYTTYNTAQVSHQFKLANGKIVESMGRVIATCTFGREDVTSAPVSCVFHVLSKVTTPVIMGTKFLLDTKTMTEHRRRLMRVLRPNVQALTVCSVGKPSMHMVCDVNHQLTMAIPDSGSEADLVSPKFALDRGFVVYPEEESVELADGSIVVSHGFIRTTVSIGNHFDTMHAPRSKTAASIDFLVLEDLNHDIIIGEHHLEELKVFTDNKHALVFTQDAIVPSELNRIRIPGAIDKSISWIKERLSTRRDTNTASNVTAVAAAQDALDDQRENARREQERARIETLPVSEQAAAFAAEDIRQRQYAAVTPTVQSALSTTP